MLPSRSANVPAVQLGLGGHVQFVDPSAHKTIFVLEIASELFFAWAITFVKCSILAFYWRIFNVTSIRKPIFIVLAMVITWIVAGVSLPSLLRPLQAKTYHSTRPLRQSINAFLQGNSGTGQQKATARPTSPFFSAPPFPRS